MNRSAEFAGSEYLVKAADQALNDPNTHLAVVRNVVDPDFINQLFRAPKDEQRSLLYQALPELTELDGLVSSWWGMKGYTDNNIAKEIQLGSGWGSGLGEKPHIDGQELAYGGDAYLGALSISLACGMPSETYSIWSATKLDRRLFTTKTGEFDLVEYAHQISLARTAIFFATRAKAKVLQGPGDAVIIPQLPGPAVHNLRARNGQLGRMLDYPIRPPVEIPASRANTPAIARIG